MGCGSSNSNSRSLYEACRDGTSVQVVEDLIASGASVNYKDKDEGGFTTLHNAVYFSKDIVEMLLMHGANPNSKDKYNNTPLHHVAEKDIAEVLLKHGANPNANNGLNGTPLHRAADENNKDVVEVLLMHGADVHGKDWQSSTPLHRAAGKDVAELLLKHGADVHAKDKNYRTPLNCAACKDVAELLLKHGADVNPKVDPKGPSKLGDPFNTLNATPLHDAIYRADIDVAELLLKHNADVNAKEGLCNCTPLHEILRHSRKVKRNGSEAVLGSAEKLVFVEMLLKYGADVHAECCEKRTPLYYAADKDIAELLLKHGADVTTKEIVTPLHDAAAKGYKDVAELLLSHGADVNAKSINGSTPLHLAVSFDHKEIAEILLKHSADLCAKDAFGKTPLQDLNPQADRIQWESIFAQYDPEALKGEAFLNADDKRRK